eukprot:TRINITY_DN3629_c0_g1_i2.p2 TRINITY_DN3629_c0_g1~~TRINITY_DN3629_c0_g1_i2.p2  ORF type:complete len:507 (-),score=120.91 TRINITY_DN3629_c0_g1_i2:43-1563(-)
MDDFEEDDFMDEDEDDGEGFGHVEDDDDGAEQAELFGDIDSGLTRTVSFEVLPQPEIMKKSRTLIDEVVQVCGVPSDAAAAVLLRHYKWNKEKLIEDYMEEPEKTCTSAGLSTLELERKPPDPKAMHSCLICLEELPAAETFALSCSHRYCKDCWKGYLMVKIQEGARCVFARCPAPKCNFIVHEAAYKALVPADEYTRYNIFLLRSYVDDNMAVKWCPAPGCTMAIRCERQSRKQAVKCKCGFEFCFRCADFDIGDHVPVNCEVLERWLQKASDESENVNWMVANTKRCPMCRSPIEKNGGCMHITCRIASCNHEFCWLCRGPWAEHGQATGGYYQCNKYDASSAKKEDEKATDAKTELETYMFYYHRYESHRNSGKIANEQRATCQKREMHILDKFNVRSQDTKFLMEAVEQLIRNRRVLQYSYVMGYYLDKTKNEKQLFEYLQEELEKHTEYLNKLYEMTLESIPDYQAFMKWKEDVTNYSRVTKKFLDNFLEGVHEGLLADK